MLNINVDFTVIHADVMLVGSWKLEVEVEMLEMKYMISLKWKIGSDSLMYDLQQLAIRDLKATGFTCVCLIHALVALLYLYCTSVKNLSLGCTCSTLVLVLHFWNNLSLGCRAVLYTVDKLRLLAVLCINQKVRIRSGLR
jgi:hypothetical protein